MKKFYLRLFFSLILITVPQHSYSKTTLYLTFDLCDGGLNYEFINYLIANKIKSNIFVTGKWIIKNSDKIKIFNENTELFKIGNHGLNHKSAVFGAYNPYHLKNIGSKDELRREILGAQKLIDSNFNNTFKYYRSAGSLYDKEALNIINYLGYKAVDFNISDMGYRISEKQLYSELKNIKVNDILLFHLNKTNNINLTKAIMHDLYNLQKDHAFLFLP